MLSRGTDAPHLYSGHHDKVFALAWSPDGEYIASGGRDQTVHIWHAHTGELHTFRQMTNYVLALAWSPDGQYLAVGDTQGVVSVWHMSSNSDVNVYRGHVRFVRSLAWSPDGRYIVSGGADLGSLDRPPLLYPRATISHICRALVARWNAYRLQQFRRDRTGMGCVGKPGRQAECADVSRTCRPCLHP